jgi:hypothetical protein
LAVFGQQGNVETDVSFFEKDLRGFAFEMKPVFVGLDSEYFLSENGFVMDPSFSYFIAIFVDLLRNFILFFCWLLALILSNISQLIIVLINNGIQSIDSL